jgi:hypothetical protein
MGHINKEQREVGTWYAIKNSSQKFYHLEGVSRIRKGWAPWVFINTEKEVGTEGVKWVSRVDTMVSLEGHSNKEQREVGTILKKALRSFTI